MALAVEPEFRGTFHGQLEAFLLLEIFFQKNRGRPGGPAASLDRRAPGRILARGEHARARLVRADGERCRDGVKPVRRGILEGACQAETEATVATPPLFRFLFESRGDIRQPAGMVVGVGQERHAVRRGQCPRHSFATRKLAGGIDIRIGKEKRDRMPRRLQPRHARAGARTATRMEKNPHADENVPSVTSFT